MTAVLIVIGAIILWALLSGSSPASGFKSVLDLPPRIQRWEPFIMKYSQRFQVPPDVLAGLIDQESAGYPNARGSDGEIGLGQLKQIAIDDLIAMGYKVANKPSEDPEENIKQTSAFLSLQIKRMGNLFDGIRAYNAGESGARNNPRRSVEYAESVLSNAQKFTMK